MHCVLQPARRHVQAELPEEAIGATLLMDPAPLPAFFAQPPTVSDTGCVLAACFLNRLLPLQPARCHL
jgi:hypothetical protein